MTPTLASLRRCLEGAVPSVIATVAGDGTPNIAYLSQVHFVDDDHVALSYQFFNKTRENILANPHARVQIIDPVTAAHYQMKLEYLRTETEGPLFENMKAKLAGIASHTGMSKVFRLLGSDVYRVGSIECILDPSGEAIPDEPQRLPGLRAAISQLGSCTDLAQLFDAALAGLDNHCAIHHSMLLMFDAAHGRLYTVASRGYPESGVGSEILLGEGIIGVAARERTPIRIGYAAREYLYSRAMRDTIEKSDNGMPLETEIPFPGLTESGSQIAVPLVFQGRLTGVLFVESPREMRFNYEDEDALMVLAGQLALSVELLSHAAEQVAEVPVAAVSASATRGTPVAVRHFTADHSVFFDNDYLIKGVAGAILWKLVNDYQKSRRNEFSNRELRLDPALKLPDITDNLEARLILLQRRLAERCPFMAIEKTGRGRFRLRVDRPLDLSESTGR